MDTLILALAIKLYKKILNFMVNYQSDIFGTGVTGDVYVGTNSDNKPAGYSFWDAGSSKVFSLPNTTIPQFNNLIIGDECSFTTNNPYLFLYVRDTLRVKVGSSLNLNGRGTGDYNFSPFLPKPQAGNSTNTYTASCLKMFLSNRDVTTSLDLNVSGGKAPNGIALSGAGSQGGGGGLVCLYHKSGCLNGYDTSKGELAPYGKDYVTANGGATGSDGGGMLIVFARNIIIEFDPNTAKHGVISANGGDGMGVNSYIDSVPGSTSDNPTGSPNSQYGGGGVVQHINLDVI